MYIKNQRFLVLGISKSGTSAAEYILKNGGKCCFYEELSGERIVAAEAKLISLGAEKLTEESVDDAIKISDAIIISPGVPINHEIAVKAKTEGKRIIGELEFAFAALSPVIVAVTGTNGKTTTVSLLDAMFKRSGINSKLVGNIGVPVSSVIQESEKDCVFVTEVSSFQLESVSDFKPHVSCILNIAPDHLERHYTMENYVFLKKRIFKNQKESEYAVLNFDDETVKSFYPEVKAQTVWVSVNQRVDGAYLEGETLFYKGEAVASLSDLPLKGRHNIYNALFAIAAAKLFKIESDDIVYALNNFKGIPHRNELVAEINGVKYYDDSKSTNTAAAITAIKTLSSPTVLILGGSEKGEKYDLLFTEIKSSPVRHTVITGASRIHMAECAIRAGVSFTVIGGFENAVKFASGIAQSGECVLLSPACASFDEFGGYGERGEAFKKILSFGAEKENEK